jgi:heme/copper-type cytochrome/quinol oxidase subunit 1
MADELERSEGPLPAPTEQIHLPGPSYLPPVMALGITLMVVGVVLSIVVVAIGAITFLITLVKWIRQTREEMRELPLEH